MSENEEPTKLLDLAFEAMTGTAGIAIRLTPERGETLRLKLTPEQASEFVSKIVHAAWMQADKNPSLRELLPAEGLTTKIDTLQAFRHPSSPDVVLRLSAGFVGLAFASDIGSLKALADWLNEHFKTASGAASKH